MKYMSLCSGIEAASVAWSSLGWSPTAFSEIEKFPSRVLAYHFPDVPNLGDMTKIDGRQYCGSVDIVVGGTPCQDFSIAGKRAGLDGERSGLALHFVRIISEIKPKWVIWENVPGVFSTNGGRDFGTFLRALDNVGYSCAWRVLNAQYFGTPQRRRRVFIVGHFGDWRPAAAVLFEPESLCGNTQTSREAQEEAFSKTGSRLASDSTIAKTLTAHGLRLDFETEDFVTDELGEGGHIRRLLPSEYERLQGFPDNWTKIPGASDSARYKALGNSMSVPVMRWLGVRLSKINAEFN